MGKRPANIYEPGRVTNTHTLEEEWPPEAQVASCPSARSHDSPHPRLANLYETGPQSLPQETDE